MDTAADRRQERVSLSTRAPRGDSCEQQSRRQPPRQSQRRSSKESCKKMCLKRAAREAASLSLREPLAVGGKHSSLLAWNHHLFPLSCHWDCSRAFFVQDSPMFCHERAPRPTRISLSPTSSSDEPASSRRAASLSAKLVSRGPALRGAAQSGNKKEKSSKTRKIGGPRRVLLLFSVCYLLARRQAAAQTATRATKFGPAVTQFCSSVNFSAVANFQCSSVRAFTSSSL